MIHPPHHPHHSEHKEEVKSPAVAVKPTAPQPSITEAQIKAGVEALRNTKHGDGCPACGYGEWFHKAPIHVHENLVKNILEAVRKVL